MTSDEYGQAYQAGFHRTVRFLVSRGAPRDGAEEAAQAAWARGWQYLKQLRNRSTLVTWVNTIALNVFRRSLRVEMRMDALPELFSNLTIDVRAVDLDRILQLCRPSERMLFEQQIHGVTIEEIARQEGVSKTAIRLRLMRARRVARSLIARAPRRFSAAA